MAVMDEFKEEREAMKNGTKKEKFSYYWMYYKWYVIIGILIIVFVTSLVRQIVLSKDDAFNGAFINSFANEDFAEDFLNQFAEYAEIDLDEYEVRIDSSLYYSKDAIDESSYATIQKLAVSIAASELDVMVTDATTIEQHAYNETFFDLREILTDQQKEYLEPYYYYIDMVVADEKNETENIIDESYVPAYPDPRKPEDMTTPIPVGIYVNDCQLLNDAYYFSDEDTILGVVVNTKHLPEALAFIDYIFEK